MLQKHKEVYRVIPVKVPISISNLLQRKGLIKCLHESSLYIGRLLWYATPIKHPKGNKRNNNTILKVVSTEVGLELTSIYFIKCANCLDNVSCEECYKPKTGKLSVVGNKIVSVNEDNNTMSSNYKRKKYKKTRGEVGNSQQPKNSGINPLLVNFDFSDSEQDEIREEQRQMFITNEG